MEYQKELLSRVRDLDQWPDFEDGYHLDDLEEIAVQALSQNSVEGFLASVLIYHQLSEELVRLLVADAHFFIQLSVFPQEIRFPKKRRQMYGSLIETLRNTISFDGKDEFLEKCELINTVRIELVHKLTRNTSLVNLKEKALKVSSLYHDIYKIFDDAHDVYRVTFGDYRDHYEDEELNNLEL